MHIGYLQMEEILTPKIKWFLDEFESILIAHAQFAYWEVELNTDIVKYFNISRQLGSINKIFLKKLTLDTNWSDGENLSCAREVLFEKGQRIRNIPEISSLTPAKI